jgi:PBP1b-binding outer membrane lipoprotein LpoB
MRIHPRSCRNYVLFAGAAAAAALAGCASHAVGNPDGVPVTEIKPDDRGVVAGTGIESQDIVTVTDRMARSLLAAPVIVGAKTPPFVAIDPVENATRFAIDKTIFTDRIRAELNTEAAGRVSFLARDRIAVLEREQQLKRQGLVTASSDPNVVEFRGADYFLTGKLSGQSTGTVQGVSDYVFFDFQLIDARTNVIVWEGTYEMKKQGLADASYR